MKRNRAFVLAALLAAPTLEAFAQVPSGFPARPLRMLVGFPPGGTNDIIARLIGQKLSEVHVMTVIGARLCCTNPVRDSSCESSVIAEGYEQTEQTDLHDPELARV